MRPRLTVAAHDFGSEMTTPPSRDWQRQSLEGLARLSLANVPTVEIVFLDALAAHLMGPNAPEPPYTIEHGSSAVSHLLRAMASGGERVEGAPVPTEPILAAREAIVTGAHAFAARGMRAWTSW